MKLYNKLNLLVLILTCMTLSGCFKWAARATNKLPEKTALENAYNYKGRVIIIGAGGAGLAAAKILEKNNIDYIILEATDRYGGRLKKDTTLADFPIDLGAEWIHSNPKVLNVIKGEKGSEISEELIPYKLDTVFRWKGNNLKPVSRLFLNSYYKFMPESKFKKSTWYDFANNNLAKNVKYKIKYNLAVNSINYSGDKVIVKTENGDIYKSDKVLVTVSIGVLKSNKIAFTPKMSNEKMKALESITFHPGFKVVMKFSEKFYPDFIVCKVKNGEKGYYDVAFKKEMKTNILGFLCTGDQAKEFNNLKSNQEIIDSLIQELDEMFDGKASDTYMGEFILENWGRHEFTQGTWVNTMFEKSSHIKVLSQPLGNKIYFAGAIYDPYKQMGAPGSMLSGYYYIDKLLTDK